MQNIQKLKNNADMELPYMCIHIKSVYAHVQILMLDKYQRYFNVCNALYMIIDAHTWLMAVSEYLIYLAYM